MDNQRNQEHSRNLFPHEQSKRGNIAVTEGPSTRMQSLGDDYRTFWRRRAARRGGYHPRRTRLWEQHSPGPSRRPCREQARGAAPNLASEEATRMRADLGAMGLLGILAPRFELRIGGQVRRGAGESFQKLWARTYDTPPDQRKAIHFLSITMTHRTWPDEEWPLPRGAQSDDPAAIGAYWTHQPSHWAPQIIASYLFDGPRPELHAHTLEREREKQTQAFLGQVWKVGPGRLWAWSGPHTFFGRENKFTSAHSFEY